MRCFIFGLDRSYSEPRFVQLPEFEQLRARLAYLSPQWIVNDDCATIAQSFDRVGDVARYDSHHTRSCNLLHAVNRQFQFTLDDLVDFLLRMEMLVDGRAALEIVVRERPAGW